MCIRGTARLLSMCILYAKIALTLQRIKLEAEAIEVVKTLCQLATMTLNEKQNYLVITFF